MKQSRSDSRSLYNSCVVSAYVIRSAACIHYQPQLDIKRGLTYIYMVALDNAALIIQRQCGEVRVVPQIRHQHLRRQTPAAESA